MSFTELNKRLSYIKEQSKTNQIILLQRVNDSGFWSFIKTI